MDKKEFVFFWKTDQLNKEFTNFYPCLFLVEGIKYRCVEQYMMAKKALLFNDTDIYEKVMKTKDPDEIKALGRQVKDFDPDIWDRCKCEIVYNGNYAKYTQNTRLRNVLLGTGDVVLAEASPVDKIWGIGLDRDDPLALDPENWQGENLLGKILMDIREELKAGVTDKYHKKTKPQLSESELELLDTVDREKLEEIIASLSAVEEIEWGGGKTGEKTTQGHDVYIMPYPKYPFSAFEALHILGLANRGTSVLDKIDKIDPHDLGLKEIQQFFAALYTQERFCDGLIARYINNGYILICLEKIRDLMDYYGK
ncbi:MAG: NADAR family protein [Mogibacterium sp.]|nr:NADAR family protein [Mogibacterium sp.]